MMLVIYSICYSGQVSVDIDSYTGRAGTCSPRSKGMYPYSFTTVPLLEERAKLRTRMSEKSRRSYAAPQKQFQVQSLALRFPEESRSSFRWLSRVTGGMCKSAM